MILPRFHYHAPTSLDEACEILAELKKDARLMAGGTDIIVNMKKGLVSPKNLVSLSRIKSLTDRILDTASGNTRIGACVTAMDLIRFTQGAGRYHALASGGAACLGTPLIRNTATIGGNLVTARPAADLPPSLMAYGAKVVVKNRGGERVVGLEDFIKGPGQTVIQSNEILTEIVLESQPRFSGGGYEKLGVRKTLEISLVNAAAFLALEKPDGPILNARIVLGAVAAVPMRARAAEECLVGEKPNEKLFEKAALAAAKESKPIDDFRGSAEYRKEMVKVLTRRALRTALQEAVNQEQRRKG
ncbi:MAG: xanthine dehydrogenase family protein subunit M [Deltaproteobacteria bacterium]|nr:xanthine dehydrogenase family protein subunit M [Deltaproteobacteria bacterium]